MTTPPIYEYRIYCTTDGQWETVYGPEPPTTCPINTAHEVNPASVQQLQLIGPNVVVSTDSAPPGIPFQLRTLKMLVPASAAVPSVVTKTFVFPYNMYIWELTVTNVATNITDELTIGVGGDTVIGGVTAPVAAGATVIPVSSTVFTHVVRGSEIGITDGTNTEHPGIITEVDTIAGTITVETPLVNSYAPGSEIRYTMYLVKDYVFNSTESLILGRKGLQSKLIPANTPVLFTYTDNTPSTEDYNLCFHVQYYHN